MIAKIMTVNRLQTSKSFKTPIRTSPSAMKVTTLAILSVLFGPAKPSEIANFFDSLLLQSANFRHICLYTEQNSHALFITFAEHLQQQRADFPHTIASGEEFDTFNDVAVKCSLVVVVLAVESQREASLNHLLKRLSVEAYWDRTAWYVVVADGEDLQDAYEESVREFGILNSLLLFETNDGLRMVHYDYFTKMRSKISGVEGALKYLASDKLRDVRGYPVKVAPTPHFVYLPYMDTGEFGIFGKFIDVYTRKMNASALWITSFYEVDLYMAFKKNVLTLYPFYRVTKYYKGFDFVPMASFDGMCMLIREMAIGSFFPYLTIPLSVASWAILFLIVILTVTVNRVLKKYFPRDLLAAYFFGLTVSDYHLKKLERVALIALTWLFFLVGEAYLAKLISFMNNNKFEPQLQTVAEFEQSNHLLCPFYRQDAEQFSYVHPKMKDKVGNDETACVDLGSCSEIRLYINVARNDSAVRSYILPEQINWWLSVHIFSARHPFAESFRQLLSQMTENGIWNWWIEIETRAREVRKLSQLIVLTFDDLISLWWLLGSGFLVASMVFVGEILYGKNLVMILKGKLKKVKSQKLSKTKNVQIFKQY